jgi:hypothetical protein
MVDLNNDDIENAGSIATDSATIGGDPAGGFGSTTTFSATLGGGWTQEDADNPVFCLFQARCETDGSTSGSIRINVDESGGTSPDYQPRVTWSDDDSGSGNGKRNWVPVYLPAGAQWEIVNEFDPNNANQIEYKRKLTL